MSRYLKKMNWGKLVLQVLPCLDCLLCVIDSKVLKPEQRDDLFETILKEKDWIGWGVHACSPQDISESMLRRLI